MTSRPEVRGARDWFAWRLVASAVAMTIACFFASGSAKADIPTITVGFSVAQPSFAVTYVGVLKGFFAQAGVNVKLVSAGAAQNTLLVSGQVDLLEGGLGNAFAPVSQGKGTTVIAEDEGPTTIAGVYGTKNIHSINDCTRMAEIPPGFTPYAWALLEKKIFNAKYEIVQYPDQPSILASLKSGQTDCTIFQGASLISLLDDGTLHQVLDPRDTASLPSTFPRDIVEAGYWGLTSNLASKRPTIVKFLRGLEASFAYIRKTSPASVAAMLKTSPDFQAFTQADLTQGLALMQYAWGGRYHNGQITKSGFRDTMRFFVQGGQSYIDPSQSLWSFAQRVDMSYLETAQAQNAAARKKKKK